LERREIQFDVEKRIQAENQRSRIEIAARKQEEPVDDGKLVEAMFDFLPDQSSDQQSTGRGGNNNVFMVITLETESML
jgi:myosin VIIa